jgi:D-alanyl-D-alanine-carboxypeptidase/D-alanyl-D-alanine-endopeptidase
VRERVASGYSPAIAAAVISANDPEPRVIAIGRGDGHRLTPDTAFEIGSITKTFTATLLADMVGRGEVRLSQPVAELLPAGTVVPSLGGRQITLEDLATHRSGLPREATNLFPAGEMPVQIEDVAKSYADYSPERLLAFLHDYKLTRAPGSAFEYSNVGEGLLGYALALRAGKPYEQLLRERVLSPLGLAATGSSSTPFAAPHDADGGAVPSIDLGVLTAAGSLRATAGDLARYARANLVALSGAGAAPGELNDAMRLALTPRADAEDLGRVGLNWFTGGQGAPQLVWHNGGTFGSSSFLAIDPVAKIAVVVLSASLVPVDDLGAHALVPSIPLTTLPKERRINDAVLADYVGAYDLGDGDIARVQRSGHRLVAQTPGAAPLLLRPLGGDRFFSRTGLSVTFVRDRRGRVTGVRVEQGGQTVNGTKVGSSSR